MIRNADKISLIKTVYFFRKSERSPSPFSSERPERIPVKINRTPIAEAMMGIHDFVIERMKMPPKKVTDAAKIV